MNSPSFARKLQVVDFNKVLTKVHQLKGSSYNSFCAGLN
ncbi:hypothetical protein LINPERPRIM_LOCUS16118 [Linum perenne]